MGSFVGVLRHTAELATVAILSSCAFRNDVQIGGDGTSTAAGVGGAASVLNYGGASFGPGGASSVSGASGGILTGPPAMPSACDVGEQHIPSFILPSDSPNRVDDGVGGIVKPGEYRLIALVEHGACPCFDANAAVAQTLVIGSTSSYVISDYQQGAHWAATFTYTTNANQIQIATTCSESAKGMPGAGPFGPFETFTMVDESLWLVSKACNYRAGYRRLPPPPAK